MTRRRRTASEKLAVEFDELSAERGPLAVDALGEEWVAPGEIGDAGGKGTFSGVEDSACCSALDGRRVHGMHGPRTEFVIQSGEHGCGDDLTMSVSIHLHFVDV